LRKWVGILNYTLKYSQILFILQPINVNMKKTFAIFFNILAISIFVAGNIVPHHHHGEKICFESHHCHSDCTSHDHKKEDKHNCCQISEAVFMHSGHSRYYENFSQYPLILNQLNCISTLYIRFESLPNVRLDKSALIYWQYYVPKEKLYFGLVKGLRAPPLG
jgi:hypothetical protein